MQFQTHGESEKANQERPREKFYFFLNNTTACHSNHITLVVLMDALAF
jgi:hypothetical protein